MIMYSSGNPGLSYLRKFSSNLKTRSIEIDEASIGKTPEKQRDFVGDVL
jgi:hypothetical protein